MKSSERTLDKREETRDELWNAESHVKKYLLTAPAAKMDCLDFPLSVLSFVHTKSDKFEKGVFP